MISKDDYCIKICKAKCCTLYTEGVAVICPKLSSDCKCTIYKDRFTPFAPDVVKVGEYSLWLKNGPEKRNFYCSRVENLIAKNLLPDDIRAGCCYAHPELLKKDYSNGSET